MEEIWKDIYFIENGIEYDYRGRYQISNLGRVRSLNYNQTGKVQVLKTSINKNGYSYVWLTKNGERKEFRMHRLVALVFIPNDKPDIKTEVNHLSEDKTDNSVMNIEWCTREYNINYGTHNERMKKAVTKTVRKTRGKKVIGYNLTSTKVIVLQGTRQAEKFGFCQSAISACCRGEYGKNKNQYKGYTWRYIEEEKELD